MATINPTTPTFVSPDPIPAVVLAAGTTLGTGLGTRYTLDLRTALGAYLHVRIGRRVATALTAAARVLVRGSFNDTIVHPYPFMDRVSQIVVAASTTVLTATIVTDSTMTVTSATGFAAGDTACIASDDSNANRLEFADISRVDTAVLTFRAPLKVAHSVADRITNLADVFSPLWLPGGDVYEIRAENQSGQALIFEAKAIVLPGYTST